MNNSNFCSAEFTHELAIHLKSRGFKVRVSGIMIYVFYPLCHKLIDLKHDYNFTYSSNVYPAEFGYRMYIIP